MDQIYQLFKKYLKNECTIQEINILFKHLEEAQDQESLKRMVIDALEQTPYNENDNILSDQEIEMMYANVLNRTHTNRRVFPLWGKLAAAASILIFVTAGIYLSTQNGQIEKLQPALVSGQILPGKPKAVLVLDDGRKISLDEAKNGIIANEGEVEVSKTEGRQLVYNPDNTERGQNIRYHKIEIPRGGEYKVVLPDGTNVWLNSSSVLGFPTRFTGKERNVELIGEGYFEVAKNAEQPFIVKVGEMKVKVLGTHFNISAYNDDLAVATTLLEGSVAVYGKTSNTILKPGEQLSYSANKIKVAEVDTETAIAWKNGYFKFDDEPIESIMKKVSRWYNVDIEYKGNVKGKKIWGTFSRAKSIKELLANLELTKSVKFKIEQGNSSGKGRRIIVMQ